MCFPSFLGDRRFWQLLLTWLGFCFGALKDEWQSPVGVSPSHRRRARAARLRQVLLELGPTFIKVGQFLSVRRDLLPVEVADELSFLQDQVPPFDAGIARNIVAAELGAAPESIFAHFEEQPLASASIGQVHRVKLRDGRDAVLKIQRPDLAPLLLRDLGYMRLLARISTLSIGQRAKSWLNLSDEFGRTLFSEIDYLQEGRNADRLRRLLRNQPQVVVPRVYWRYTGRKVLALEYLPGTKINNLLELNSRGLDLRAIANLLVDCYLQQVVFHGYFHADPHPGNLAIDEQGNLVLYDFGMMSEISPGQRAALVKCIRSVIGRDPQQLISGLVELEVIKAGAVREPIAKALSPFMDYYSGTDILQLNFQQLEKEVDQIILDQSLCLPSGLAYLIRAGTSIEGVARMLKPNFSFVAAARPVFKRFALSNVLVVRSEWFANRPAQPGNGNYGEFVGISQVSGRAAPPLALANLNGKLSLSPEKPELLVQQQRLEKALHLVFLSLVLLSLALLLVVTTAVPEYRPLGVYILIGNGLLGAIIIQAVIKPAYWYKAGGRNIVKGNGDRKC